MEEKITSSDTPFDEIIKLSGLDKKAVTSELHEYIHQYGKELDDLTLNELRTIIAQYARKTILELFEKEQKT